MEEVRQEAGGRRKEKVLTGKGFLITLLSGHDITQNIKQNAICRGYSRIYPTKYGGYA
ncbi:MAG: hypothetical protein F6K39_34630 [Okeania sp. SIO3B3]|nr:hypothetical protein [Okeania sp. SIO3B3]